jgi:uncharacterized membrane protein YqiK
MRKQAIRKQAEAHQKQQSAQHSASYLIELKGIHALWLQVKSNTQHRKPLPGANLHPGQSLKALQGVD